AVPAAAVLKPGSSRISHEPASSSTAFRFSDSRSVVTLISVPARTLVPPVTVNSWPLRLSTIGGWAGAPPGPPARGAPMPGGPPAPRGAPAPGGPPAPRGAPAPGPAPGPPNPAPGPGAAAPAAAPAAPRGAPPGAAPPGAPPRGPPKPPKPPPPPPKLRRPMSPWQTAAFQSGLI